MIKKVNTDSRAFNVQWMAVCQEHDFSGPWRSTKSQAIKDGLAHQDAHPSHKIKVLEKYESVRFLKDLV